MSRAGRLLLLLLLLALPGCAYFNSFYNAQRSFAEAERAAQRGESVNAERAYLAAIEKAAISYRRHPDSRWADDALLLVARSRFAVGQHAAARAALGRVREQTRDPKLRAFAGLYLGAALTALGQPDSALAPLAEGLGTELDDRHRAFGLLWRGRARLDAGQPEGLVDLETAAERMDDTGREAALELGTRALRQADTARFHRALARLLDNRAAQLRADSVLRLVDAAERRFGAPALLEAFGAAPAEHWEPEPRGRVGIRRARLTAAAGDTALAVRQLGHAVQHLTGPTGGEGRLVAARWQLTHVEEPGELGQVRSLLLPGAAHPQVADAIRRLRIVDALLDRGRAGEGAGLFAAAEFARDTLGAPHLARTLFLAYADAEAGSVWAPKALLAALPLAADAERERIRERVRRAPDNPYVAAVDGRSDPAAFQAAEAGLASAIAAVRAAAVAEVLAGDTRAAEAVQARDSSRLAARTEAVLLRCGAMIDSLAVAGIRADSVRAACLRSDSTAVARYLAIDTLQLRLPQPDSTGRLPTAPPDTIS